MRSLCRSPRPSDRRGVITLLVASALLVVLSCTALVLDRLYLSAVRAELTTTAEAAALAAARQLVGDDRLTAEPDLHQCVCRARKAGIGIAGENDIAGRPVRLHGDEAQDNGDIRFGRLVANERTGITQFLENEHDPTTVLVTAHRTRRRNNPVALFFRGLTGQTDSDVVVRAEASVANRIAGLRPLENGPVPALPLAILKVDPTGRAAAWDVQIEGGLGFDNYGFDPESKQVESGGDGLREIVLQSRTRSDNDEEINVRVLDLGRGPSTEQITRGWTVDDLDEFGGELRLSERPEWIAGTDRIASEVADDLRTMIGQPRIVLLYNMAAPSGQMDRVRCMQTVAGRIMDLYPVNGGYEIVFQPSVLTTRTALLGNESTPENRYIYKLHLTQ